MAGTAQSPLLEAAIHSSILLRTVWERLHEALSRVPVWGAGDPQDSAYCMRTLRSLF